MLFKSVNRLKTHSYATTKTKNKALKDDGKSYFLIDFSESNTLQENRTTQVIFGAPNSQFTME